MEQSISSLAFRGSILEAIAEAKREKKLFVVYTAGDTPESKLLETSTWIDPNVCETLSKYCVLLHILEGSSEASNFSAIYPQHSAPCITAIGYTGVQLWQKEGFVSADVLASSLEKAWLSLHVQETTAAAFLTAAFASASGTSGAASSEQMAQETDVSTPVTDDHIISRDAGQSLNSNTETDSMQDGVASPSLANASDNDGLHESISTNETGNASRNPEIAQSNSEVACPVPEKKIDYDDNHLGSSNEGAGEIVSEATEVARVNKEASEVEKTDASDYSAIKSNDVFLNIRLPDASNLQVKFLLMDTLKMVKDYINENQTSSLGSFSIAIPYPRKVFNDQDLDSTLSELGFFNRQALVVVPNNQTSSPHRGGSSQYQTHSTNGGSSSNASEGYWASARRILSYVNPLSYLSRSASSPSATQDSQSGIWQYNPNPSLQDTLRGGTGRSATTPSPEQSKPVSGRKQAPRFGGNIHTLKHEDDDSRFNDRNTFWNGNSTQFGGDNDGGK